MECALVPKPPEGSDWTFEIKLDGYRAIGVKGDQIILYSRNRKNFNKRFPQIVKALADLPDDTVIDGEVVALDESGDRISTASSTSQPKLRGFTILSLMFSS